jgi:heparanase
MRNFGAGLYVCLTSLLLVAAGCAGAPAKGPSITPTTMARIGTVDERFQSYNIEMLEVTGGDFWKPYASASDTNAKTKAIQSGSSVPAGMDPNMYQYRPPMDLMNAKLRTLAAALGPAYVRVSGTWANATYLSTADEATARPPKGFTGVLKRQQWAGVVDFSHAVDAKIITSFATSPGTRDANGVWTPAQARRFLDYTKALGGSIAAAEFMNEPTLATMGGAPIGYDAAAYGRDFKVFHKFAKQVVTDMVILGPGSVAETMGNWGMAAGSMPVLHTRDLLVASGPGVDAFSYHHYGASSLRCRAMPMPQTRLEDALSEQWLARTDETLQFYQKLRDEFEPGKPMWLSETADAACGGNPWGSAFLDTFRYLDQLGRLARSEVQVVAHNTLVASDYGLLDENTLTPKPNYWGALLWRKLMGTTVLDSGVPIQAGLHVYAHCQRGAPGGVMLLAINTSLTRPASVNLSMSADRYTLTAQKLEDPHIQLNGHDLKLGPNDEIPKLQGSHIPSGHVEFGPASITFLAIAEAENESCR